MGEVVRLAWTFSLVRLPGKANEHMGQGVHVLAGSVRVFFRSGGGSGWPGVISTAAAMQGRVRRSAIGWVRWWTAQRRRRFLRCSGFLSCRA